MSQKAVIHTDGLAADPNAGAVGSTSWDVAAEQPHLKTQGGIRSRVGKDYIDDQHVFQTDIGGTAEDKLSRTTPESA